MLHKSKHLQSTVERALAVRARGDIEQVAVPVAGRPSFMLKDPLTLEHFQLTPAEHFLWERLREPTTLAELKREFEARFAPRTITHAALQQGINQLFEQGLLVSTSPAQGKQLLERARHRGRLERWQSLLKVLSFRVASWDSGDFLDSLHLGVRRLFSRPLGFAATAVVMYALWLLVAHSSEVAAKLPDVNELWTPGYLVLWLVTIVGVKVLHELGHAVTCRHYGGRCHEMGVMLLALLPALYCDVSDVWRFPRKWQRMAVSAAGMIVEVVLAALALVGWWYTEPGLLNTWLLGVAVIGSVGTLAVNANPLLRYDGYYLLADWLEIPNMGSRAQGLLFERLRGWLLDEPRTEDPLLSRTQQRRLAIYAVASRLYSVVVILAIYAMLFALARPYHLENLVLTLAVFTPAGMALPTAVGVWRLVRNPANRARIKKPRLAVLGVSLAVVAAIVLFFPIGHTVEGEAVLVPAEARAVYATMAGELANAVAPGTTVRAGDVIAELHDPQMELAVVKHAGEFAVKQAHFQQLNTLRALESRLSMQLPTAQADLQDAKAQLAQYRRRAEDLVIRAPVDGVVIATPDEEQETAPDRLATWSGSPLDVRNRGCWLEPSTVICTVGDPTKLTAFVTIDERDVAEIQPGESVKILLDSAPVRILGGTVKQVGSRAMEPSQDGPRIAAARRHVVEVELDAMEAEMLVGTGGTAKIEADRATLVGLAVDFVKRRLRMPW
jgi:putative peptide zinc metalloprotease protein